MRATHVRAVRATSALLCAMLFTILISVNTRSQATPDFSKAVIKTTKIADNFYTLEGPGGTIGVLTGPDGVLMVDTKFAPLADKIVAAIKDVSPSPIRFVINTHVHIDHIGANEALGKMGATIFAREEVRERMVHPGPVGAGAPDKPLPPAAVPVVTYTGPLTFYMDGEEVEAIPVPHAHTDGDSIVWFHNDDVIMSGDFYRAAGYPNMDIDIGGSLKGMLDGLAMLAKIAGPNTKIIPGHGAIVDRTAVMAQRDMIVAVRDRIAKLIAEGKTLNDVLAAHVTSDYDAKVPAMNAAGDKFGDRFIGQVYAEIKAAK